MTIFEARQMVDRIADDYHAQGVSVRVVEPEFDWNRPASEQCSPNRYGVEVRIGERIVVSEDEDELRAAIGAQDEALDEQIHSVYHETATPAWVLANPACRAAWYRSLTWRADAAKAKHEDIQRVLIRDAERIYGEGSHV